MTLLATPTTHLKTRTYGCMQIVTRYHRLYRDRLPQHWGVLRLVYGGVVYERNSLISASLQKCQSDDLADIHNAITFGERLEDYNHKPGFISLNFRELVGDIDIGQRISSQLARLT